MRRVQTPESQFTVAAMTVRRVPLHHRGPEHEIADSFGSRYERAAAGLHVDGFKVDRGYGGADGHELLVPLVAPREVGTAAS